MKGKSGESMIMLIICMAIITTLCLSLLFTATVLLHRSNTSVSKEQCRIMAVSLSEKLETQLTSPSYTFESKDEQDIRDDGSLWFYIKKNIWTSSWPYFNEDEKGHTARFANRTFTLDAEGFPAGAEEAAKNCSVVIYWESERDAVMDGSVLVTEVTCSDNDMSCTIKSEYSLGIKNIVKIVKDEETDEEYEISYEQWTWSKNWRE